MELKATPGKVPPMWAYSDLIQGNSANQDVVLGL